MLLWLTTIVSPEAIYIGLFLQKSHGDANEQLVLQTDAVLRGVRPARSPVAD
jgi:hypothetical protein